MKNKIDPLNKKVKLKELFGKDELILLEYLSKGLHISEKQVLTEALTLFYKQMLAVAEEQKNKKEKLIIT